MVTLRQLRYLGALAKHQHFGRAAESCGITQPALSMQIRDLEAYLGIELVERRRGEIALTEIGLEVARRGEDVLASTRDLIDYARHRSQPMSGRLALGVIPSLAPYVLPRILPALHGRYPALRIELRETLTQPLVDALARGVLDVLLLAVPVEEEGIETLRLFDDPFLLAVPAKDRGALTVPVFAQEIDPQRLILLEEGHCLREQTLAYCGGLKGDASPGLGATSLATVMQMVANGYGITLVPQIAADVEVRDDRVKLLHFAAPEPQRTIGLAWRRTSPRKDDFVALGQLIVEALSLADATSATS